MPYYWNASHASAAFNLNALVPQPVLGRLLVTGSSNPINLTDFDTLIGLVEGEVGAAMAQGGYTAPVPSTAPLSIAFTWVQKVVKDGAFCQLLKSVPGSAPTAKEYCDAYAAAIKLIQTSGAAVLTSGGAALSVRGDGIPSAQITASWQP